MGCGTLKNHRRVEHKFGELHVFRYVNCHFNHLLFLWHEKTA